MAWFVPLIIAAVSAMQQMQAERQQAAAEAQAAEYNATQAERQAKIADLQGQNALDRGEANRETYMRQFAQEQGARSVNMGASGTEVGSGSNAEVLADNAAMAQLDADTIRYNAAMEKWNYDNQAESYRQEANLQRKQAAGAIAAGKTNQMAALLNGAGSMAQSYFSK